MCLDIIIGKWNLGWWNRDCYFAVPCFCYCCQLTSMAYQRSHPGYAISEGIVSEASSFMGQNTQNTVPLTQLPITWKVIIIARTTKKYHLKKYCQSVQRSQRTELWQEPSVTHLRKWHSSWAASGRELSNRLNCSKVDNRSCNHCHLQKVSLPPSYWSL